MSRWNRLTNGLRAELVGLPVWTTEEDRRRALSYEDRHLAEARETITAVRAGRGVPANFGEIVAVARYEDAGWMPDGCFDRWHRWSSQGAEQLHVDALVQWLGCLEHDMQDQLHDIETKMSTQCRVLDERLAEAQANASRARWHLHEHLRKLVLARLSVEDTDGAREIAHRLPVGPPRDTIDNIIHEHSALYNAPGRR